MQHRVFLTILVFFCCVAPVGAADNAVTVSTREGLQFAGGDWEWRIIGRLNVDAAFYDSDGNPDFKSGTEIRRMRFGISGKAYRHWAFKVSYAFVAEVIHSAYISYSGLGPVRLQAGYFKEPFSLEALTSSKHVNFIERSVVHSFSPGHNTGLMGQVLLADRLNIALGVFEDEDLDEDVNFTGRVAFSPLHEKTRVLHLGTALSYRSLGGAAGSYRLRARPETHVESPRLVDTGTLEDIDSALLYNLEAAGVWGPFAAQVEYNAARVDEKEGRAEVDSFRGWRLETSWFLTGESRNYSFKSGSFGATRPKHSVVDGGPGAWQTALRYSDIDLGEAGGAQKQLALGVNWHPIRNLRFMLEYLRVLDHQPKAGAKSYEPGIVQARAQFYW